MLIVVHPELAYVPGRREWTAPPPKGYLFQSCELQIEDETQDEEVYEFLLSNLIEVNYECR